ncbi:MAG: NAD-dependent epimerase/dehydratase family protein [Bacillota bacterium]
MLITGSNGFIAGHLVRRYLQSGVRIIGIDLGGQPKITHPNYQYYSIDINDWDSLAAIFAKHRIDAVLHLAAIVHRKGKNLTSKDYEQTNFKSSEFLFRLCAEKDVMEVVFFSTIEVYGTQEFRVIHEDVPPAPITHYGISKFLAEKAAQRIFTENNTGAAILRLAPVYSRDFMANIARRVVFPGNGFYYYFRDGLYSFSFCSLYNIMDLVDLILAQRARDVQIYNVADSDNYAVRDVIRLLSDRNKKPVIRLPYGMAYHFLSTMDLFNGFLKRDGYLSGRNLVKLLDSKIYSVEKLALRLNYFPSWSLDRTLQLSPETRINIPAGI